MMEQGNSNNSVADSNKNNKAIEKKLDRDLQEEINTIEPDQVREIEQHQLANPTSLSTKKQARGFETDINKSEKFRGSPPLFILIKMFSALSKLCSFSRK